MLPTGHHPGATSAGRGRGRVAQPQRPMARGSVDGDLRRADTEVVRLRIALVAPLLPLGMFISGCGSSEDATGDVSDASTGSMASDDSGSPPPEETAHECDTDCRAERRAQRCRTFLSGVTLRYDITAEPADAGREIGLHMTLVNRTGTRLAGSTAGTLRVSPGPPSNRISWGGSSADEVYQKPGTASRREVWHERQPPGWHPVGDRVTSFDFSTYAYAPGHGTVACFMPAAVRAPRGLVVGHPSGRWMQQSHR